MGTPGGRQAGGTPGRERVGPCAGRQSCGEGREQRAPPQRQARRLSHAPELHAGLVPRARTRPAGGAARPAARSATRAVLHGAERQAASFEDTVTRGVICTPAPCGDSTMLLPGQDRPRLSCQPGGPVSHDLGYKGETTSITTRVAGLQGVHKICARTSLALLLQCPASSSIGEVCSFASPLACSRRLLAQHTITSVPGPAALQHPPQCLACLAAEQTCEGVQDEGASQLLNHAFTGTCPDTIPTRFLLSPFPSRACGALPPIPRARARTMALW